MTFLGRELSVFLSAIALTLWSSQSMAAPSPEVWAWDSTVPTCSLKHEGSRGEAKVTIQRTPGNDQTDLIIALASGSKLRQGQFADATVATDSGRKFLAYVSYSDSKLFLDSPDPEFIENLAQTGSLHVSHPKLGSVTLPIDVPPAIISTLRQCEDETMIAWGLDPATWRKLKTRPQPISPPLARFKASDYPPVALQQGVQADSIIRLDIAPDGSVSNCSALNRTSTAEDLVLFKAFESVSCKVLKGATFRPATDPAGKPVTAPIVYDVRYRLAG
jgi:hypothetical protein